jgi:hypothetical protein
MIDMGKLHMNEAMEITSFKLAKGFTAADFVAANAGIDEWLKLQPGFQSRRIGELEDGSIIDVLIWDSSANGKDAAERIMDETGSSPVHAAIDQRSVIWRIAEIRQTTTRGS